MENYIRSFFSRNFSPVDVFEAFSSNSNSLSYLHLPNHTTVELFYQDSKKGSSALYLYFVQSRLKKQSMIGNQCNIFTSAATIFPKSFPISLQWTTNASDWEPQMSCVHIIKFPQRGIKATPLGNIVENILSSISCFILSVSSKKQGSEKYPSPIRNQKKGDYHSPSCWLLEVLGAFT